MTNDGHKGRPAGEAAVGVKASQGVRTGAVLSAMTIVLLTTIQEPVGWAGWAWVALVPWVVAAVRAKRGERAAGVSFGAGVGYYLWNLSWLWPVSAPGMVAMCLYLALYFPLCGYVLRGVYLYRRWPFTLVLPVLWVGQEYLRAVVMTGFAWFFLGHSQHEHEELIQICDLFGVYGLTFLIAMVNGFICDLLLRPWTSQARRGGARKLAMLRLAVITLSCLTAAWMYGRYRFNQGQETMSRGPLVTVVQDNVPQYVKLENESALEIFNRHIELSEEALEAEIEPLLLVWPETMAGTLNAQFLLRAEPSEPFERLLWGMGRYNDERLAGLAQKGAAILVGSSSMEIETTLAGEGPPEKQRFNSAELYLADGSRYRRRYDKMHLVPFGEVVPFRHSWPWMYRLLNKLTPYDYEYTLDAGTEATVFELTEQGQTVGGAEGNATPPARIWRFGVAICYEDVMPAVIRKLTRAEGGEKRVDFLLNISNEGWYLKGGRGEPLKAGAELIQHLVISKFRAIENRVGLVRSVNMGISGFIRPDGTVQGGAVAGTLPANPRARQAVEGFMTDRVYLDSRVSVYNRIGDIFAIACAIALGLLFVEMVLLQIFLRMKSGKAVVGG